MRNDPSDVDDAAVPSATCIWARVAEPASHATFFPTFEIDASGRKSPGTSGVITSSIVLACSAMVDLKWVIFLFFIFYFFIGRAVGWGHRGNYRGNYR